MIYTKQEIREQIMGLDLPAGFPIIMHTSLRAVGKLEGGAERCFSSFSSTR